MKLWTLFLVWVMLAFMNATEYAAELNKAFDLLRIGKWEEGWRQLEKRVEQPPQPWWNGEPCGRVVIFKEGGHGDFFQFARYFKLIKNGVFTSDREMNGDAYTSLLSLPLALKLYDPADSPRPPYIFAVDRLADKWRSELSRVEGFKVGIAWQGNPTRSTEPRRSIPLEHFLPLADVPDVTLFSIQKGFGIEQIRKGDRLVNLGPQIDNNRQRMFEETAGIIQNLDLVITSDTAIAHLAGGLAKQVWLALHARPDWRWGIQGETTPWYPSMRLFRQSRLGDWESVFQQIANELRVKADDCSV